LRAQTLLPLPNNEDTLFDILADTTTLFGASLAEYNDVAHQLEEMGVEVVIYSKDNS
jgi:hypothetical protein